MAMGAILAGVGVGVVSAMFQQAGFSLVGIQSIAVGTALGVLLLGMTSLAHASRTAWFAVAIACCCAIATQHIWLYNMAMASRADEIRRKPAAELFRPGWSEESLFDYLSAEAEPWRVGLWLVDGCLLTIAAVVIVNRRHKMNAQVESVDGRKTSCKSSA